MLCTIAISRVLASPFSLAGFPKLTRLKVLLTFKTVEQDSSYAHLKILPDTVNNLLEQIGLRRAEVAVSFFLIEIQGHDLVDGIFCGERDEGQILGDVLPVIDENGFKGVGEGYADRGSRVESLLL